MIRAFDGRNEDSLLDASMINAASRPPSLIGIIAFPLLGIAVAELLHTRKSELLLFVLPGPMGAIQVFIAQFQEPKARKELTMETRQHRAVGRCVAWNQLAVIPLVITEAGAIIALRPDVPWKFACVIIVFFATYVVMRLRSRHYWLQALGND